MYNRDELANAILKLLSREMPEREKSNYVTEMSENILGREWMNYLFQTDAFLDQQGNVKLDRVCTKILSYKAILL